MRSPVVSLGSGAKVDLFFLRKLASATAALSRLLKLDRVRVVVHAVDLSNAESMDYFQENYESLLNDGYRPVLLGDLA